MEYICVICEKPLDNTICNFHYECLNTKEKKKIKKPKIAKIAKVQEPKPTKIIKVKEPKPSMILKVSYDINDTIIYI